MLPLFFGTLAALIFDAKFPFRGLLRGVFVMPMMATPVAVALVWTMMFHPQLGVLNYLLSFLGIGPQEWIYNQFTVIPSLVLVETWQWTPLVMLIVLGGLAAVPREPYESAEIDGANAWQKFRYLTVPMIAPFLMIAVIIRSIDAIKSFDIIYAMTQGGPVRHPRRSTSISTTPPLPITISATARPWRLSSSSSSSRSLLSCSWSGSAPTGRI